MGSRHAFQSSVGCCILLAISGFAHAVSNEDLVAAKAAEKFSNKLVIVSRYATPCMRAHGLIGGKLDIMAMPEACDYDVMSTVLINADIYEQLTSSELYKRLVKEGAINAVAAGRMDYYGRKLVSLSSVIKALGEGSNSGKAGPTAEEREHIKNVQNMLTQLGYDVGPIDGLAGKKTIAAIKKFETDNNLPIEENVNDKSLLLKLKTALEEKGRTLGEKTNVSPTYDHSTDADIQKMRIGEIVEIRRGPVGLYTKPSSQSERLLVLSTSEMLTVVSRENEWLQVETVLGKTGWIQSDWVKR